MQPTDAKELLERYLNGSCTSAEMKLIEQWYQRLEETGEFEWLQGERARYATAIHQRLFQKIKKEEGIIVPMKKRVLRPSWVAAASVILILMASIYFIVNKNISVKPVAKKEIQKDIFPGHDGAILTLANGKTIVLDNAQDGKITDVAVKNGNKLSYQNSNQASVEYNTMTTPKGRQFSLVLPDGTNVWLNAASSITYPTMFVGNERKVSITGEAYFEVAHNASKPFHVNVNGMDVQVLGTHFNINSYSDEEFTTTTLLQGSVKISKGDNTVLLKPGQQAKKINSKLLVANDIDVDAVMAWKNGYFSFNDADMQTVMRQLARWYDVEVIYRGAVPDKKLYGKISRNINASNVLAALQYTGVKFTIEGNKIIVAQ